MGLAHETINLHTLHFPLCVLISMFLQPVSHCSCNEGLLFLIGYSETDREAIYCTYRIVRIIGRREKLAKMHNPAVGEINFGELHMHSL